MKDLLDKISSYNIFNFLFPGVIFSVFVSKTTSFNIIQEDVVAGAFVYYFIGSVISRIGSLVLEPLLKRTKFLSFAPYEDFVSASKIDPKIEILSETNNTYRTLCSAAICVALMHLFDFLIRESYVSPKFASLTALISLFILFLMAYKKQTSYISQRVSTNIKKVQK